MPAKPGTNDGDGDGKKGGSVKADSTEGRLISLEKEVKFLRAVMERNGWTL